MKTYSALASLLLALLLCLGQLAAAGSAPRRPTRWTKPSVASLDGRTYATSKCQSSGGGCWGMGGAGVYGTATTPNALATLQIDSGSTVEIAPAGRGRKLQDSSFSGAVAISAPNMERTQTFGKPSPDTYAKTLPGTKGAVVSLSLSGSYAVPNSIKDTAGRSWSVSRTVGSKNANGGALTSAGSEATKDGLSVGTYATSGLIGSGRASSYSSLAGRTRNRKMLMA